MTSVAFSGVQKIEDYQYLTIANAVRRYALKSKNDHFITGAATGVDTLCFYLCTAWAEKAQHTVIVPAGNHNTEVVNFALAMDFEVIEMPEGTNYLDRNTEMIKLADLLVAFPGGSAELFRGSGTWSTIRRARKKGIPIHIFPLDKSQKPWKENV